MVKCLRIELKEADKGILLQSLVPCLDRGRGSPRNIIGVVMNRDLQSTYTLAKKKKKKKKKNERTNERTVYWTRPSAREEKEEEEERRRKRF